MAKATSIDLKKKYLCTNQTHNLKSTEVTFVSCTIDIAVTEKYAMKAMYM